MPVWLYVCYGHVLPRHKRKKMRSAVFNQMSDTRQYMHTWK